MIVRLRDNRLVWIASDVRTLDPPPTRVHGILLSTVRPDGVFDVWFSLDDIAGVH